MKWRRSIAAVALGVSVFGVAACDGDNPNEVDQEIEEEKEDITEEKEDIQEDL